MKTGSHLEAGLLKMGTFMTTHAMGTNTNNNTHLYCLELYPGSVGHGELLGDVCEHLLHALAALAGGLVDACRGSHRGLSRAQQRSRGHT